MNPKNKSTADVDKRRKLLRTWLALSFVLFLFSILYSPFLAPSALAWYDASWPYRKKISINPDKVGSDGVTNFPILFSQTDNDLRFTASGGHVASSTAGEIVFTDVSGTKLDHEIESYTSTTGALVAWVKVPSISPTSPTTLYIYYGNAAVTTYQATTTGVWTNSYAGVYHLGDGDSTAASFYKDATSNARHGTLADADGDSITTSSGKIGAAMDLNGDADNIGFEHTFGSPTNVTISAWVNLDAVGGSLVRTEIWNVSDVVNTWLNSTGCCGIDSEGYFAYSSGSERIPADGPTVSLGAWHYVVYTYTSGTQKFYIDNVEYGSGTNANALGWTTAVDRTGRTTIGGHSAGTGLAPVDGKMDEARIPSTNRSAAWLTTEYNNQSSPSTFYSYGTEDSGQQARLNMPPNYLRTDGGLVGHWTFNGKDMTPNVRDVSGQGNHGNLSGQAATTTAAGKLGQALTFDGTDDRVTLKSTALITTVNYTIAMWVNPTRDGTDAYGNAFFYQGTGAADLGTVITILEYTAGGVTANGLSFYHNGAGSAGATNDLTLNVWQHIAVVKNGATATVYKNGVALRSFSVANNAPTTGSANLGYWYDVNDANRYYQGNIDDVRVYSRVLSASEILQLSKAGTAKINVSQNSKVTSGLVGLWSFNGPDVSWTSATAGTATDRSGQGNTGTLTNMSQASSPTQGKVGQALSFDGTNDYVDMGDVIDPGTGDLSVFAWIKTTGTSGQIVNKRDGAVSTNAGYQIFLNTNNISFAFGDGSATRVRVDSTAPVVNDGAWHMIGAVFDRDGNGQIYVDGATATSGSGSISAQQGNVNNAMALNIGREASDGTGLFTGQIDDVRIYSRALSATEILQLYNIGKTSL